MNARSTVRTVQVGGPIVVHAGPFSSALADNLRGLVPAEETVVACSNSRSMPKDGEVLVALAGDPDTISELLAPSVAWAHVLGAGVDGFPFDALGDRPLTCSRGASAVAIAEWVLAVMLAFEKKLPETWVETAPAHWSIASLGSLAGRTVGLVGLGAIGNEVARRVLAFDAPVVAVRRTNAPAVVPGVEVVTGLHELLARSITWSSRPLLPPARHTSWTRRPLRC